LLHCYLHLWPLFDLKFTPPCPHSSRPNRNLVSPSEPGDVVNGAWVCLPRPPVLWMKKVAWLVIWLHVNMSYASMVDVCWPTGSPAVSVRWDTRETPVTKPSMRLCLFLSPSASWWSSSASSSCSLGWHFSDKGKRQRREKRPLKNP
ncbi:hypothetical protein PO909_022228, partial [Leuciscus waleckii]